MWDQEKKSSEEWEAMDKYERPKPRLTMFFNMKWQKHSIGRLYDSASVHGLIIGVHTKNTIDIVILSKDCQKCIRIENHGTPTDENKLSHNYGCISKDMEATAALKLARHPYKISGTIVTYIVGYDESTMR